MLDTRSTSDSFFAVNRTPTMFIDGLSDWEKRRLALILKERGQTAFMVIKHATAAVLSAKRGRPVNPVDRQYLELLDATVEELYGYHRYPNELKYDEPARVQLASGDHGAS